MNHGIKTIIYPVKEVARARALYRTLLGSEPVVESSYYIGFQLGDQHIGLDPNGHRSGMVAYHHVDDIRKTLQSLLDAGATTEVEVRDVGQGRLIATVKDAEGNLIGLLQG